MVPTLSQIQQWDVEHLQSAARWWDSRAEHWASAFETVRTEMPAPGGTPWTGQAGAAAIARAGRDSAAAEEAFGLAESPRGQAEGQASAA